MLADCRTILPLLGERVGVRASFFLAKSFQAIPLAAVLIFGTAAHAASSSDLALQSQANVMVEIAFQARADYADPFNDVTLDVIFHNPKGHDLRVPAFWAGSNVWKVRYASPITGTHRFRSECSKSRDKGLDGVSGTVEIKPYAGENPLYVHGPLQVAADKRYLEHADHTPFFWLGDTWWMGLCHRLHWPDEVKQLATDRKEKGFTVIQIVAGLYPDMHPFDPRGANEAGFPWETNYARIRPQYFDAADQRLGYLVDQGLSPCIVGAWGYFMPWMGVAKMKSHWRYLIARYGAWPVTWCAAGEANLPWYQAKGFPYDDRKQVTDWTEVMAYIRATDPYHRPLTIHPTGIGRLSARHATDKPSLLDFDMLQTPHGTREAVPITITTVRESYADMPRMPVIDGEASYEMLGDSLPTEWTRRMFWICMMNGAAGHTYGANGIWQCNRKGQPHGPSPTAGSPPTGYGVISWDEAMNLPGSRQVGLGKKLLEQYPWQDFKPHPEWASFASESRVSLDGCSWIWFPEGDPAKDAPAAKRYFRRTFVLPADKQVAHAVLNASADDGFVTSLNGKEIGSSSDWRSDRQFNEIQSLLHPGTNVLTILAENKPAGGAPDPAGLIACLEIRFAATGENKSNQDLLRIVTDATWHSATNEIPGWEQTGFDDTNWPAALMVAPYGAGPWGRIGGEAGGPLFGPQATGKSGGVRVIYVPENKPVRLAGLGDKLSYTGLTFDPVSGAKKSLVPFRSDASGSWTCPPPDGNTHDWVLVLESSAH